MGSAMVVPMYGWVWGQWAMEAVESGVSSTGVWVRMYGGTDVWMGAWAVVKGVSWKWRQVHGCVGADVWGYGCMDGGVGSGQGSQLAVKAVPWVCGCG